MAYKEVIILGKDGFIGQALSKVNLPPAIYYFDSPSSGILFDENLEWCVRKTVVGFIDLLDRVKRTGEYLVYPSSATVYNKNTNYAKTKGILEDLVSVYGLENQTLGLRIAAGYGPGELHKGRYASVVYQWCHEMKEGKSPVIFGDGTQTRDFIYEDDIADNVSVLANKHTTGIVDLGTGINTSFNELVHTINYVLEKKIEPTYVSKPKNYVPETKVKSVPCKVSLEQGIRNILNA